MNRDLSDVQCSRLVEEHGDTFFYSMAGWTNACHFRYFWSLFNFGIVPLRNINFRKGFIKFVIILCVISDGFCSKSDLPVFKTCNSKIYLEPRDLHQGQLEMVIRDSDNSANRVSCDFTVHAGPNKHIMFYFTDVYLGSPNKSERIDRACIDPRDVTTHFEGIPQGMRASICSRIEVELIPRVYYTKGHALTIRFYRNRGFAITAYFKLVFVEFRTGACRTTERKCKNDRCIAHELVCNDRNPCGDYSDCPTGLEHLSSFAMCGIVILGLLSGGIIIIMAAVCLQRSSSKNFDIDEFSSVNGVRQQDNTMEMADVNRKRHSGFDQCDSKEKPAARDKVPSKQEKIGYCNGVSHGVNDSAGTSDKELLLHQNRGKTLHNAYSDPFRQNGSDVNLVVHNKTSRGDSDETVTTNMSSFDNDDAELDTFKDDHLESLPPNQTSALMPEVIPYPLHKSSQDIFLRYSGNGIILTDSDSGNEGDSRYRDGRTHPQQEYLLKNNKHAHSPSKNQYHSNGKVGQPSNHVTCHVFTDFKPSAPHYGHTLSQRNSFDVPISPQKPYTMNVK